MKEPAQIAYDAYCESFNKGSIDAGLSPFGFPPFGGLSSVAQNSWRDVCVKNEALAKALEAYPDEYVKMLRASAEAQLFQGLAAARAEAADAKAKVKRLLTQLDETRARCDSSKVSNKQLRKKLANMEDKYEHLTGCVRSMLPASKRAALTANDILRRGSAYEDACELLAESPEHAAQLRSVLEQDVIN